MKRQRGKVEGKEGGREGERKGRRRKDVGRKREGRSLSHTHVLTLVIRVEAFDDSDPQHRGVLN